MKKRSNTPAPVMVRPGESGWELWRGGDGPAVRFGTADHPGSLQGTSETVLALPAKHLISLPLWLTTSDVALVRGLIEAQLERRGLVSKKSAEAVFDYLLITQEPTRMLVLAYVLQEELPETLIPKWAKRFDLSARFLPVISDHLLLWKDMGNTAMALYRGSNLASFQVVGGSLLTEQQARDLGCLLLSLNAQQVVENVEGIVCLGNFEPSEVQTLKEALGLPVKSSPLPPPRWPKEPSHLMPRSVRKEMEVVTKRSQRNRWMAVAAGVYLLLLAWVALSLGRVAWEVQTMKSEVDRDAPLVQQLKKTAERWRAAQDALEPQRYPIEILSGTASLLPEDGVRLTLFSLEEGKIIITGEARDSVSAVAYQEAVKKSPALKDFAWVAPVPSPLPNNTAKFRLEGTVP